MALNDLRQVQIVRVFGVILMGSSFKQNMFIGLWLVGLSAVVALLWHEDRFFATAGIPIAVVSETQKDVTYRGEDDIRWKSIGGGQSVFDGDKLATGPKSKAVIDFGDGRAANVGPNTQMVVSSIRQASGLTYIINLSKGSVAIQKNPVKNRANKSAFPVIIRSGGRDYLVEPGEERGVTRDEKGVKEFVGRKPPRPVKNSVERPAEAVTTKITVPTTVVASLMDQTPIAIVPGTPGAAVDGSAEINLASAPVAVPEAPISETPVPPAPVPVKPKKPVVKPVEKPPVSEEAKEQVLPPATAVGTEIELDLSGLERKYYTFDSLKNIRGEIGVLKWREPATGSSNPQWAPAVELKQGGNLKEVSLPRAGSFVIKLEDFGDLQVREKKDGIPCGVLELRGGATVLEPGKKPVWSFAGDTQQIHICSYKDAAESMPLIIGMSSLEPGQIRRPRLFKRPVAADLKFQMIVTTPSLYQAILPTLASSESFRVAPGKGFSPSGIFISKSGKVVVQLAGAGITNAAAEKIRQKISGDIVFKGSRDALYDGSKLTENELRGMIARSDAQGRKIYVHKSGNLVAVSRGFLEERQEVAAFIKSISSQMFTEKVKVISYK